MNWIRSLIGLVFVATFLSSCTNERTSNSEPVAHVQALIRTWGCPLPFDSTKTVYFDGFFSVQFPQLLDDTPARRALVTFQDVNDKSQSEFTDKSSCVDFALKPGIYRVLIESTFWKPDTISDYRVTADTSIVLDYVCNRRLLPGQGH